MREGGAERRWIILALVAVVAIAVPCAVNAVAWIGRPFPGFLILENGIIVSIGRSEWVRPERRRTHWTRLVAVEGQPVTAGLDLHAYVERAGIGKTIRYTFRQGTDMFELALEVRPFTVRDFLELFLPFLAVGLLTIVAGAVVVARRPGTPETRALFVYCLALGTTFLTSPDEYYPYWFTPLFFLALCTVPPSFVHLALAYPQQSRALRRPALLYAGLYMPFAVLGACLLASRSEPSFFLPLLYSVYFFAANAILLYIGRLAFALIEGVRPLPPVVLALAAIMVSSLLIVGTLVTYPLLTRPLSTLWIFGPALLFPTLTGLAFLRFPTPGLSQASATEPTP